MLTIFESLLPVFLIISLGILLRYVRLVPRDSWASMEKVSYWVFFPAFLFSILFEADLSSPALGGAAIALFCAALSLIVLMWLLRPWLMRWFQADGPSYTSLFQSITRWNGFVAIAIVERLYGAEGATIVALGMAVMVPILNIANVTVLALYASNEHPTARRIAMLVLKNPFVWGSLGGMIFNVAGIPLYEPLAKTVSILGSAALSAGLLLVGAALHLRSMVRPDPLIWFGTLARILGVPVVYVCFAVLLGVEGNALISIALCGAVPTAMAGYVLARQMGGNADAIASIATLQTVLSFVTMPLIISTLQWIA